MLLTSVTTASRSFPLDIGPDSKVYSPIINGVGGNEEIPARTVAVNILESTNPPVVMAAAETRVPLRHE